MIFSLDREGFVTHYLYSGRKETEFLAAGRDTNQLRYEKYLRSLIGEDTRIQPPVNIHMDIYSNLGMPWKYYYSYGNVFLDQSEFYTDLKKVELYGATEIIASRAMEVTALIWSYARADVWLNGEYCDSIKQPVYKPIQKKEIRLKLNKGPNQVFVHLKTAGVRDTRISFALQIMEGRDELHTSLPIDEEQLKPYVQAEQILNSCFIEDGMLKFDGIMPRDAKLKYFTENIDYRKQNEKYIIDDISDCSYIQLKDYPSFCIEIQVGDSTLRRYFERMDLRTPKYLEVNHGDRIRRIYEDIAKVSSITRSETDGFALYPMLARYYLGINTDQDIEEFRVTLSQIDRRMDCADFMICALIRFMKNYPIPNDLEKEIKNVMLGFRYWMDEDGQDGMCFWSENHSLMFYQAAYFFGQEYREDVFIRSGKTGDELYSLAKKRLKEWLCDVILHGYDEFNSGVYLPITFAALLNLVDYGEEELASKAEEAVDLLINRIALHCFRQVMISPQGRVYRDVLYPYRQAVQSIIHYLDKDAPYVYNEWLISLATSNYRFPKYIKQLMEEKGSFTYSTSNGVVELYKTDDYILTSVQSPPKESKKRAWEWDMREEIRDEHIYTKSLNECFHGTTAFEPGVLGYQQHMWYAALDKDLVVFINHPGESCEAISEGRPGYWYGNGIMPALVQEKNVLGMIYVIDDSHPIGFTHLYWDTDRFDETKEVGNWIFGRKDGGYIGIWCSGTMSNYNDMLFNCEKRVYGRNTAYLCICGSRQEDEDFNNFVKKCMDKVVIYEEKYYKLSCEDFELSFIPSRNETQYVQ